MQPKKLSVSQKVSPKQLDMRQKGQILSQNIEGGKNPKKYLNIVSFSLSLHRTFDVSNASAFFVLHLTGGAIDLCLVPNACPMKEGRKVVPKYAPKKTRIVAAFAGNRTRLNDA